MHPASAQPLIADNWLLKKWICFDVFNIAAFQKNFDVNGGELKTIVGNDIFRIVVMAKNI